VSSQQGPYAEAILVAATRIADRLSQSRGRFLVAVGGPGGTGKSTFCHLLARGLPGAAVLPLDDYRLPRAERRATGLLGSHPAGNRMDLLRDHLLAIRSGCPSISRPVYDPMTGCAMEAEAFHPQRVTILDGEIAIYDGVRELADFSVFVGAHWRFQLRTRLERDVGVHGFSREKALAVFRQSNLGDYRLFGRPARDRCDLVLWRGLDGRVVVER